MDTYERGSDISNIVAKAFLTVTPTADIAIQNGGGVRVDVDAGDYVGTYTEYAQGFIDYVNGLTSDNLLLEKLPVDEYSTKQYIGTDDCNHSTQADCSGY